MVREALTRAARVPQAVELADVVEPRVVHPARVVGLEAVGPVAHGERRRPVARSPVAVELLDDLLALGRQRRAAVARRELLRGHDAGRSHRHDREHREREVPAALQERRGGVLVGRRLLREPDDQPGRAADQDEPHDEGPDDLPAREVDDVEGGLEALPEMIEVTAAVRDSLGGAPGPGDRAVVEPGRGRAVHELAVLHLGVAAHDEEVRHRDERRERDDAHPARLLLAAEGGVFQPPVDQQLDARDDEAVLRRPDRHGRVRPLPDQEQLPEGSDQHRDAGLPVAVDGDFRRHPTRLVALRLVLGPLLGVDRVAGDAARGEDALHALTGHVSALLGLHDRRPQDGHEVHREDDREDADDEVDRGRAEEHRLEARLADALRHVEVHRRAGQREAEAHDRGPGDEAEQQCRPVRRADVREEAIALLPTRPSQAQRAQAKRIVRRSRIVRVGLVGRFVLRLRRLRRIAEGAQILRRCRPDPDRGERHDEEDALAERETGQEARRPLRLRDIPEEKQGEEPHPDERRPPDPDGPAVVPLELEVIDPRPGGVPDPPGGAQDLGLVGVEQEPRGSC